VGGRCGEFALSASLERLCRECHILIAGAEGSATCMYRLPQGKTAQATRGVSSGELIDGVSV
jgi:hypothetical protein